jgi:phosphoglucosamine mutase
MVRYPQVLINVAGVDKAKVSSNSAIAAAVTAAEVKLGSSGRVLLRASGTEPLIRVMVEAESAIDAHELSTSLAALVKSELSL